MFFKKISNLCLMSLLCACAGSFEKANENFTKDFNKGMYQKASVEMANTLNDGQEAGLPKLKDSPYLASLQIGTASLFANNYKASMAYFDTADKSVRNNDTDGYDAKFYEKIMYNTYSAVSAMNSDPDNVQMYMNKASKAQIEIKANNKSSIDKEAKKNKEEQEKKAKAEAFLKSVGMSFDSIVSQANKTSESEDSVISLPQCKTDEEGYRSDAEQKALANYTNTYATWLYNVFASADGKDNVDDQNFLKANLCGRNKYVYDDAKVAASNKPTVWVVFENGLVGSVEEHTMLLPNPFDLTKEIKSPLKIKWAKLKENPSPFKTLLVNDKVNTEFLASMDAIVDRDLKNLKTSYIVKSTLWEIGKIAIAAAACNKKSCPPLGLVGAIAALATEYPGVETRSWTSLPKEVQMARLDMPKDRTLKLSLIGNDGLTRNNSIELPANMTQAIVTVRVPTVDAIPSVVVSKIK